jgi:hypothetical protein
MRRLVPTLLAAAIVALAASACYNGRYPDTFLTEVTPTCKVATDVAQPLRDLLDAAHGDGVSLRPETSAHLEPLPIEPPRNESCYRSYEMQVWWHDFYCFFGKCQFAAVPGTSVHGWGRAVDFEDDGGELTFSSSGYQWLAAHAAAYGFEHPSWAEPGGSAPEPWHWEHP